MAIPSPPPEPPPPGEPVLNRNRRAALNRDRRETARAAVVVGLVIVVIVFAVVNLDSVKVDWIVGSGHAPLIIVIAISMVVGMVLGWLSQHFRGRRRGR